MKSNPVTITVQVGGHSVTTSVRAEGHHDYYGADADGNRGMWVWDIYDYDWDDVTHTDSGLELTAHGHDKVIELICDKCDDTDFEFEPDYKHEDYLED